MRMCVLIKITKFISKIDTKTQLFSSLPTIHVDIEVRECAVADRRDTAGRTAKRK